MSFGQDNVGVGPFGHSPVQPPTTPGKPQELSVLIHPGSRDAVVLDDGSLLGVHPVDQAVYLALGIEWGKLGPVPSQGARWRTLVHAGRDLEARARNVVETALSSLISRGDVALDAVLTTPIEDGFITEIRYRNLRLPPGSKTEPLTITNLR